MLRHKYALALAIVLLLVATNNINAAQVLFSPELFVSEKYSDNIDLDPQDEVDDYITTAGLSLTGRVLWRKSGVELNYRPSYNKFAETTENDLWRHSASLYWWNDLTKNTRLELRNTFLQTNEPDDESEAIDPADPISGPAVESDTNRRGRIEYYTNVAEIRLSQQFGADDSFYFAYEYRLLRDLDIPSEIPVSDNDISIPSFGLILNFSPKWGMELDASYATTSYVDDNDRDEFNGDIKFLYNFNRIVSVFVAYQHTMLDFDQEIDEDFRIYRPSAGIRAVFPKNAGITIGAGSYTQDFDNSDDEQGFNVDSEIYKTWAYRNGGHIGISAGSGYEIDDNGSEDNGLSIYYKGRLELGYQLSRKFSTYAYGSYRYADFPNEIPDRVDISVDAGAGIKWQMLKWMVVDLSYEYSNVSSDDPANEYTENSAVVTISTAPTRPFKLN